MKRLRYLFLVMAALFLLTAPARAEEEKVLNIYNWSEYIPQAVLDQFTAETGIKIVYSTYESNEAMYAKLKLLKGEGYDIVVPSTYFISQLKNDNLLQPIDKSKISNFNLLMPRLVNQPFDPNNEYTVPYMWGSTGLIINRKYVDPTMVKGWKDLLRPEFKGRVLISDDLRDGLGIGLKAKGYSINTRNENELKEAYEFLLQLKDSVRVFDITSTKQNFVNEEVYVGAIWNGDAYVAWEENENLKFIYPEEGAMIWIDSFAIPVKATHPENAHKFINFMLRPEVSAAVVEEFRYSPASQAVLDLLPAEMRDNRTIAPTDADLKNSEMTMELGDALQLYEKYWEKFKTEQ